MCVLSCFSLVQLFATPWTVACQAPLSTGFSRQEFSRRVAMPSSRVSSQARDQTHRFFTTSATWEAKKDCLGGGNMKEKCLVQFLRVSKEKEYATETRSDLQGLKHLLYSKSANFCVCSTSLSLYLLIHKSELNCTTVYLYPVSTWQIDCQAPLDATFLGEYSNKQDEQNSLPSWY